MLIYLPLLVAIIGAIIFIWNGGPSSPSQPRTKVAELGLTMFLCGLLAFLLTYGPSLINVIPHR